MNLFRIPRPGAGRSPYGTLTDHPQIDQILPWIKVTDRGKESPRFDLSKNIPPEVLQLMEHLQLRCQHKECPRDYTPFRRRCTIKTDGTRTYSKTFYITFACGSPYGCYKGDAATEEARKLLDYIRRWRRSQEGR